MMLLDTSGLLAFIYEAEPAHDQAVDNFLEDIPKLVTDYVLIELVSLAVARRYSRDRAIAFIMDLIDHPLVKVVWGNRGLFDRAIELLENREDKRYTLCDATSFVLMRDYDITDALTLDHHFEQEGFRKLLK